MYVYLVSGAVDVVPSVASSEITKDRVIFYGARDHAIAAEYPRSQVFCAGDMLISPAF
jgi:hypothetical protein